MRTALTIAALTAALVVTGAPLAQAKDDERPHHPHRLLQRLRRLESSRPSTTTAGSRLEYEVDSNQSGQTWRVRVRDNGVRVIATRATTGGRSGSFEIERKVANRAGSDSFVARARDLSGGQLCVARLTF